MRRRCGHRGGKRTGRVEARRAGARRRVTVGVAAAILVGVLLARAASPAAAAWRPLCGLKSGPAPSTYQHVVVIMDENKSFSDIIGPRGSAARRHAPFLNHLAARCGMAAPSGPVTGGSTSGSGRS